jgi:hypothetical protein
VHVEVRLGDIDVDALCELREWLHEHQPVRQYARMRWADTPGGNGLEALHLNTGSGFSLLQLAVAIGRWREMRRPAPTVLLSRVPPDGRAVSIESTEPAVLREVIHALEAG